MIIITSWLGRIPMLKAPCNNSSSRSKKAMAELTGWARDKVQGQKLSWSSFVLVLFWLCSWRTFHPPPPLCSLSNTSNLAKPRNKTAGISEAAADFGCGKSLPRSFPSMSATARVGWPKDWTWTSHCPQRKPLSRNGGSVPILGRHRPHRLLWSVLKGS